MTDGKVVTNQPEAEGSGAVVALEIPDPRQHPVPPGWFEQVAAPAILAAVKWAVLDEYEARLRAMASYIASFEGDSLEFEKALRLVEKRRGDLLGPSRPGVRTDLQPLPSVEEVDEAPATKNRWRKIAENWDDVWPTIRDAQDVRDVTQAAILRVIDGTPMGVHYSSATAQWATPQDLYNQLHAEFGFTLDVCATAGNAKCERFFTDADDGLAQTWEGVCWMNPPYGDAIAAWVAKARGSAEAGATVVCLVPARTDTGWWWDHCRLGEIRFLRGRLKFGGHDNSAPFPSAVVIFGVGQRVLHWER